jgi:hypothetical protein
MAEDAYETLSLDLLRDHHDSVPKRPPQASVGSIGVVSDHHHQEYPTPIHQSGY